MALVSEPIGGLAFGRFCLDPQDERLHGPDGPIKLGNKAFQVLLRLLERGGRLVTKDELMASVWDGTIVSEFSLTSAVKELRRALRDDARTPSFIESVYGRGYRFLAPVERVEAAAPLRAPRVAIAAATDSVATAFRVPTTAAGLQRREQPATAPSRSRLHKLFGSVVGAALLLAPALTLAQSGPGGRFQASAASVRHCSPS